MADSRLLADRIPSLPQALIRVLDAVQEENGADFRELTEAVQHDNALTARLLAAANSPMYFRGRACDSIGRALVLLGPQAVKTVAMTAAIQRLFETFEDAFLPQLWRRALLAANLGQVIANLTRYPQPEQAYLCGLLLELGKLARLSEQPVEYGALLALHDDNQALAEAERNQFAEDYAAVGAALVEDWGLSPTISDPVRFQLESTEAVQDAQPLVRLMNLVSHLVAAETSDKAAGFGSALARADRLFGLNEGLVRELRRRVDDDVQRLAESLGIPTNDDSAGSADLQGEARRALGERVRDISSIDQFRSSLLASSSLAEVSQAARRCLSLTLGLRHALPFWLSDDGETLLAFDADEPEEPLFRIRAEAGRSLVADCLLAARPQTNQATNNDGPPPVVDRQLRTRLGDQPLWRLPVMEGEQVRGVLVLGIPESRQAELSDRMPFLLSLCRELARSAPDARGKKDRSDDAVDRSEIREVLHEASNPLSIIQNYLAVLHASPQDDPQARDHVQQIRNEIDRVGRILLRLRDPQSGEADQAIPAADMLQRLTTRVESGLCQPRGIQLDSRIDADLPRLRRQADPLQQVLTNLLKNAAEALDGGGRIELIAETMAPDEGTGQWRIIVSDDGPGLPRDVRDARFSPVRSGKKDGNGLGLSIAKRLVDEMQGTMTVQSSGNGTRFELLLPIEEDD
ncbi:HDOD domain-containing protein [Methylonatrum kenyense]|uniref:HDOD domain-containing protein n=1 Tax=Methylonatrum kenyense TaxID=455253 RepID=UPI0020BE4419|nr:HDOD domain-containing protein [Methylonatrum kenyense]MCK8517202.1 HDOD domain-containing protein [Methylonatrum kenyense]